jgi:hypothetical protein
MLFETKTPHPLYFSSQSAHCPHLGNPPVRGPKKQSAGRELLAAGGPVKIAGASLYSLTIRGVLQSAHATAYKHDRPHADS